MPRPTGSALLPQQPPRPKEGASPIGQVQAVASILAPLVAGMLLAFVLLPGLFRQVPNDQARIHTILTVLRGGQPPPDAVVLGSSVAMNGIDGSQLSAELLGNPLVYNLAASAQELADSVLLLDALPPMVRTVVQVVYPTHLESDYCIGSDAYAAYHAYGLRPTRRAIRDVSDACGEATEGLLAESPVDLTFDARWVLAQAPDRLARDLIRRDIDSARAEQDLYFPATYPVISRSALEALFVSGEHRSEAGGLAMSSVARDLLRSEVAANRRAGRTTLIVLAPVHPRLRSAYGSRFFADLHALTSGHPFGPGGIVVDATSLLSAEDFNDHVHASADGARRLTDFVARALADLD